MGLKILPADREFSRCIREAANWTCERCGAQHQEGSMGLHCAHYMSRGNWSTRFEPDNTVAACYGCHSYLDREPYEKARFFESHIGKHRAELLQEKSKQPAHGLKKEKKAIAAHYRDELKRLKELRKKGQTEKLTVIGY